MKPQTLLTEIQNLFFPEICAGCNQILLHNEEILCTTCMLNLPKTHYQSDQNNPVAQIFWGRCKVENAAAFLYFTKKGIVQNILHRFKYKGEREIGYFMGKFLAHEILETPFSEVDGIVPVPLHFNRLKERGYNQTEFLAQGISEVFNIPVYKEVIIRKTASSTQTRKHRYERWLNVNDIFENAKPQTIEGKHILLVDDVITTGATLEACAHVLLQSENTRISILALACA